MPSQVIKNDEEMIALGRIFAHAPFRTFALHGDLGAGKTTFIKGFIHEKTAIAPDCVSSPTFNIMNVYLDVRHFDCYRLKSSDEFLAMGLDEEFDKTCLIEWPSKIESLLPSETFHIHIDILSENEREVTYDQF